LGDLVIDGRIVLKKMDHKDVMGGARGSVVVNAGSSPDEVDFFKLT
jgi:hypothetical protein